MADARIYSPEQQAEALIADLSALQRVESHLAAQAGRDAAGLLSFREQRKALRRQILMRLLQSRPDQAIFQAVLDDMVLPADQPQYKRQLQQLQQDLEALVAG